MSQDLSGGGRRAQRDKEFFPASEVAKAKSGSGGRSKSEMGCESFKEVLVGEVQK
jgi:hypothetical protein